MIQRKVVLKDSHIVKILIILNFLPISLNDSFRNTIGFSIDLDFHQIELKRLLSMVIFLKKFTCLNLRILNRREEHLVCNWMDSFTVSHRL